MRLSLSLWFVLAGAVATAGVGYGWGYRHASTAAASVCRAKLDTAAQTIRAARSERDDAAAALATIQATLADTRAAYRLAIEAATDTLAQRDQEVAALRQGLQFKLDEINHVAKQWEDCETLAHDPVCAPVARRLWPAAHPHGDPRD